MILTEIKFLTLLIPMQLIDKIGHNVNELNANYLKKPMKREGAFLEIR